MKVKTGLVVPTNANGYVAPRVEVYEREPTWPILVAVGLVIVGVVVGWWFV